MRDRGEEGECTEQCENSSFIDEDMKVGIQRGARQVGGAASIIMNVLQFRGLDFLRPEKRHETTVKDEY
jgi:hypothetical protein